MIKRGLTYLRHMPLPYKGLAIFVVIGLLNSLLANDKPLIAVNQKLEFPAFTDLLHDFGLLSKRTTYNKSPETSLEIYPPIPYAYTTIDGASTLTGPTAKHWMGTDQLGRDVAAGMVRGTFTALIIGFFSSVLAYIFGTFFGILAGYFGNDRLKLPPLSLFVYCLIGGLILFYAFYGQISMVILLLVLLTIMILIFNRLALEPKVAIPVDHVLMRAIEIRKAIPALLILMACLPLFDQVKYTHLVLLLALLSWPVFARHARSESLSLANKSFIKNVEGLGFSYVSIIYRHLWPSLMPTLRVVFTYQVLSNILLETSLSFLGIGIPANEVSWGSLLNEFRQSSQSWWLLVFPALALILLSICLRYAEKTTLQTTSEAA